jgi:inorganic pyrophosphatase
MNQGNRTMNPFLQALGVLFQSHPWHGVAMGEKAPEVVNSYVEVIPTDTVKYELDKTTGLLRLDRPQRFSSVCPTVYGFVPQTLCGPRVAARAEASSGRIGIVGDADPVDICILTERVIDQRNILVEVVPIGGLRMLDGGEADDKIIAVLRGDAAYGGVTDIAACPSGLIERLKHYFLTYKQAPDAARSTCEIVETYGREEALEVIRSSHEDYLETFSGLHDMVTAAMGGSGS